MRDVDVIWIEVRDPSGLIVDSLLMSDPVAATAEPLESGSIKVSSLEDDKGN